MVELADNPNDLGVAYIAGPMSNCPEYNYPAFEAMAKRLRGAGWQIVSPHELHPADPSKPHDWYMRRDLQALVHCGRIVMLDGWERSKGARIEHFNAVELGMKIFYQFQIDSWTDYDLVALA